MGPAVGVGEDAEDVIDGVDVERLVGHAHPWRQGAGLVDGESRRADAVLLALAVRGALETVTVDDAADDEDGVGVQRRVGEGLGGVW